MQAKPIIKVFVATIFLLAIAGCAKNSAAPAIATYASTGEPEIEASATPNLIEPAAQVAYRSALEASRKSAGTDGLTELWYDTDKELVQIVVQDPKSKKFVSYDVTDETLYPIDGSAMMPARLLAELDGLITGELDKGSVMTANAGGFVITNTIDLIEYVTTYTVDDAGRIATASIIADDEPLGNVTYSFTITAEGKKALAAN